MHNFADRLADAVRQKGPLCVGIDPRWESLPIGMQQKFAQAPAEAFTQFGLKVLELCVPNSGIVKFQAAFFELLGPAGMQSMQTLIHDAREQGYFVILDAKRGDIASTATAYAQAAFGSTWNADALTVNPYLGADAIEPFITEARNTELQRGLFVLVRTSNPGGGLFQNVKSETGPLYRHVAEAVATWNEGAIGECGYGDVGAVVGATNPNELRELREAMPKVWFLVPGYGAQGGTAEDARAAMRPDDLGAIVNSSRGITFPFKPDDAQWEERIQLAAKKAQAELRGD